MTRAAALAAGLGRASRLLNPLHRFDGRLLRLHPVLWRTQVLLVTSYALVVAAVLYWLGARQSFRSIAEVPVLNGFAYWGTLSLFIALLVLAPWFYRNLQTRHEGGTRGGIVQLFLAYLSCFFALNLVPTAYQDGTLRSLATTLAASPNLVQDEREFAQFMEGRSEAATYGLVLDTATFAEPEIYPQASAISVVDAASALKIFGQLHPIFARHGLGTCVGPFDMEVVEFGLTNYGPAVMPACSAPEAERMLRPEAARSVPPGDPQAVLPLRFTIKTALGPGNRVALTLTSFQARLATLVAARRHAGWRDGTIYHPLNGWRLGMVVLLALAASGLSCRDLLPPMGGRWTFAAAWRARLSFVRHGRSRRSARRFRGTPAQSLSLRAIAPHLLGALAWFGLAVAFFFAFVGLGNTGLILPASISIYIGVPASLVASYMTLRNAYLVYDVEDLTDMSRRFYGMMNGLYVFLVASLIYYMGALYQPSSESAEVAFSVLALLAVWLAAVMEGIWAAKLFRGAGSSTNRVPGLVLLKVLAFLVATVLSVPVIVGATLYLSEFFGGVAGNLGVLTYSGVLAIALLLVVRIRVAEAGVIFFKLVFNVLLLGFALSLSLVVLTAASTIDIGNSSIALALGSIATALVPLVAIRLLRPWTARHFFRNVAQALRQPRWT